MSLELPAVLGCSTAFRWAYIAYEFLLPQKLDREADVPCGSDITEIVFALPGKGNFRGHSRRENNSYFESFFTWIKIIPEVKLYLV